MSIYQEKRGPNWGAALQTLGAGIGQYAEQKRLEEEAKRLRQQQLDDEARKRDQYLNDFYALHGQPISQGYMGQDATGVIPMDPVAALGQQPLPDYMANVTVAEQSGDRGVAGPFGGPMRFSGGAGRPVESSQSPTPNLGFDYPSSGTMPIPAEVLGLKMSDQFTGPAVPNIQQQLDPNVILGGKSVPYAPWMQGMAPDAASEIYTRMNPVPKTTTPGDVMVSAILKKRDGGSVRVTMKQSELDNYLFNGNYSLGGMSDAGEVTLVERQPEVKPETEANKRGARKEAKDISAEIIESRWGNISAGARRDKDGTLIPGAYNPGSAFGAGSYGQVGETIYRDLVDQFNEAVANGAEPTFELADAIFSQTMPQYDPQTIPSLDASLAINTAGFQFDPATNQFVRRASQPFAPDANPIARAMPWATPDETRLWTDFLREVGDKALEGAKPGTPVWNTVNAWLRNNGATIDQLNASAKAANAVGITPGSPAAAVTTPKSAPMESKQAKNGKRYVKKPNGEWWPAKNVNGEWVPDE